MSKDFTPNDKLKLRNNILQHELSYTEHQKSTVQKCQYIEERNKIQPLYTLVDSKTMDKQDQVKTRQSRKVTRKTKLVKNKKIDDEKLKFAMKTWLEQKPSKKCSQDEKSE